MVFIPWTGKKGSFERLRYAPHQTGKPSRPPLINNPVYGKYDHITYITEDVKGNIWIGTSESGVHCYTPGTGKTVHFMSGKDEPGNYADRTAWTAYTSRDGVLWLSSIAGNLYKVNLSQVEIPFYKIPGAVVNAILTQEDGITWVGTQNMGLFRMSPQQTPLSHFKHKAGNPATLSQNWISGLAQDSQGRIWVGTHNGLNGYNPHTNSFTRYLHKEDAKNSLPYNRIHELETDRQGNLWLCTEGGLVRRDVSSGKFTLFRFDNRDSAIRDNAMLYAREDLSGNIWAAFNTEGRGVVKLDPHSGKFDMIPVEGVTNHIAIDPVDGQVWVSGTNLSKYDSSSHEIKKFVDAYIHQPLRATRFSIIDSHGNLWAGTPEGIVQVDLSRQGIVRVFGKLYGVNGKQIAYQAATSAANGNICFGSYDGGYYVFSPGEVIRNLIQPNLVFTGFRLAGKSLQTGALDPHKLSLKNEGNIQLKHDQNIFSFQFAAIDFIDPENNRQYYKLENYDENWIQAGPDKRAFYFKVPPGEYRFKVKAANSNGLWTEQRVAVLIAAPWWSHWWVWAFAILAVVSVIYGMARWRMHQKFSDRLQRSEQEKEIAHLKNKAAELEMQALRSQMNPHFIFNSLNSINRFILQNNRLQAAEYLTKFSRLMRLILQNSQATMIPLDSELEALKLYLDLEVLRFDHHFNYHIAIQPGLDTELLKVPPLIIQPFAENAIWHGLMHKDEKGHLEIAIEEGKGQLHLKITDDGIGRQRASALASKSATKKKSMGLKITAGRLSMLQQMNGNTSPVIVNDLVNPDGTPAGTGVIIKLPVRYD